MLTTVVSATALEKAAFRAPTKQELTIFRKMIEAGDYNRVRLTVWENPRFLVSCGDTPTNLKEGYRYNSMHICAISNRARIAELILQTVSNARFAQLYAGKKGNDKMCRELSANLLDYYLNIPEKGRSETPLHFAAKNGAADVVEVLTSYPECKMMPNNEGLLPKDIICSRVSKSDPVVYKKIESMLAERFYVPVLRSADNAIPPKIGQPFSPNNPPVFQLRNSPSDPFSPEVKIQALAGPMSKDAAQLFCRRWKTPPRVGSNVNSPVANNPYISPMKSPYANSTLNNTFGSSVTAGSASGFTAIASTTPIKGRALIYSTPYRKNSPSTLVDICISKVHLNGIKSNALIHAQRENAGIVEITLEKIEKQNGNDNQSIKQTLQEQTETFTMSHVVANIVDRNEKCAVSPIETNNNKHKHPQSPLASAERFYRKMLYPNTPLMQLKRDAFNKYRDVSASPFMSDLTVSHIANSNSSSSPELNVSSMLNESDAYNSYKERHIKNSDTEKGLEVIGRLLARQQNVEWREYWDFLDAFVDIASTAGLEQLENFFAERKNQVNKTKHKKIESKSVPYNELCTALDNLELITISRKTNGFNRSIGTLTTSSLSNQEHSSPLSSSPPSTAIVLAGTPPTTMPQSTTPYTCVEKSLQVFAKRMTKSIINNIDNVVSINDTLLSELKRLKSLICSFKEDTRFHSVDFSKVHSRIGNLVASYVENSQEVTVATKIKIQGIIRHLLMSTGERREHLECVCTRIVEMLGLSSDSLPDNLNTEELCSETWEVEKQCECPWENNLSRKSSRRKRFENLFMQQRDSKEILGPQSIASSVPGEIEISTEIVAYRINDDSDEMDENDVYWSDFDSETDEGIDGWHTAHGSPSSVTSPSEEQEDYEQKIFVYGNEPTKRDLDLLNATFHIDIDKSKYPRVYAWRETIQGYTNEEMDLFPSPSIFKASSSNSNKFQLTPNSKVSSPFISITPILDKQQQHQSKNETAVPIVKRLFASPVLAKFTMTVITPPRKLSTSGSSLEIQVTPQKQPILQTQQGQQQQQQQQQQLQQQKVFQTPLGKVRGLFSLYRERLENSPILNSSSSDSSLLNVSATGSD